MTYCRIICNLNTIKMTKSFQWTHLCCWCTVNSFKYVCRHITLQQYPYHPSWRAHSPGVSTQHYHVYSWISNIVLSCPILVMLCTQGDLRSEPKQELDIPNIYIVPLISHSKLLTLEANRVVYNYDRQDYNQDCNNQRRCICTN